MQTIHKVEENKDKVEQIGTHRYKLSHASASHCMEPQSCSALQKLLVSCSRAT